MKRNFWYKNSLSVVFIGLFILSFAAQVFFGWRELLSEYQDR